MLYEVITESDVFDTIGLLNGSTTVGYSHRDNERMPLPIVMERDKGARMMDEATRITSYNVCYTKLLRISCMASPFKDCAFAFSGKN